MKTVCIVPIKKKSSRVKRKNFKKINRVPLYKITLKKVKNCKFDEVYVDTDSQEIKKFCVKNKIKVIDRIKRLALDSANGNDLLNYHSLIIKADLYFQIFITSPLLSKKSINECIAFLKKNKKFDSILTCKKIFSWFWFKEKPINYKPQKLPRSQDALPIMQETTGLYGIRRNALIKNKCRIGKKPYFFEVSNSESLDLDNYEDFKILKSYAKK